MQLRFASFAVINLQEDFHLQECARAGRTIKRRGTFVTRLPYYPPDIPAAACPAAMLTGAVRSGDSGTILPPSLSQERQQLTCWNEC